jgi:hypothetical protein
MAIKEYCLKYSDYFMTQYVCLKFVCKILKEYCATLKFTECLKTKVRNKAISTHDYDT